MPRKPTAGVGSNQYATKGSSSGFVARRDLPAPVVDEEAEDAAWAFDPQAEAWRSVGVTSAQVVRQLQAVGVDPETYEHWSDYQFSVDAIVEWRRAGNWQPFDASGWQGEKFDPVEATEWSRQGFTMMNAPEWRRRRFAAGEAAVWVMAFDGTSYAEGQTRSMSGEAADWRAAGMNPQEAQDLINVGVTAAAARQAGI